MCALFGSTNKVGGAVIHLQKQIENAPFEFAGQQKSAGLMVDETNKPAH